METGRPSHRLALLTGALLLAAAALGGLWPTSAPGADPSPPLAQGSHGAGEPLTHAPFLSTLNALDAARDAPAGAAVSGVLRNIAAAHNVPVPAYEGCATLAEAIQAHAERLGLAAAPVAPVVPAELDAALGCLLGAVHDANLAMDRTFDGVSSTDLIALYEAATEKRPLNPTLMALLDGRDHGHNLIAAIHAVEAVDRALPLLRAAQASGLGLPPIDLEPILLFAPDGDDVHDRNYALIVDLEGNDVYDNHAGGVFVAVGSAIWEVEPGSGYFGTSVAGQNVVVAGNVQDAETVLSAGMVLDLAGDDTYGVKKPPMLKDLEEGCTEEPVVPIVGAAGGGVIGLGMLFDLAGDDTFVHRTGSQGTGHILGVGVLYSGGGNDRFEAIRLAQGSGLLGGIGLLLNAGGQNTYLATPPSGGVFNGDLLVCDDDSRYVQGSAFDRRPGPALPSIGILADLDGHTSYATVKKGQGFGQGAGLGLLYDPVGDDTYHAEEIAQGSAQGRNKETHPQAPWSSGYSVLYDKSGDDTYTLTGGPRGWRGQGYSAGHPTPPPPLGDLNELIQWAVDRNEAIGILYDEAGADSFHGPPGRDNDVLLTDGILGVFYSTSP